MTTEPTYVIVGASLAGAKAAERLREDGFGGRVVLVGAESELPYERPPLSKGYLLGNDERGSVFVHDEAWYAETSIELMLGTRATGLDVGAHRVELDDGSHLDYAKLLLATGSSPRRLDLPGAGLAGVHYLRELPDSDQLRATIEGGGNVVVVGAGWIGLETAAAAREKGCTVTVLEPQPVPLRAALGDEMGAFFADVHREHGVDLRLGQGVSELRGDGTVTAVVTDDGSELPADAVIVGIGIVPNTGLAEAAGLTVDNGVVTDAALRTSDPDVYAAGDVARSHRPRYGTGVRVEHWANALNGGAAAGSSMAGKDVSYDDLPFFFTDQYDLGMEFAGWFPAGGYDQVVVRGTPSSDGFYAFWVRGDRVVAGMHVNQWDDGIGPVETLLNADKAVDLGALADTGRSLTEVASA